MSSCIGRYSFLSFVALATIHLHLSRNAAFAQVYFTGPYGPGGTWNLYEQRGFVLGGDRLPEAGAPRTWIQAHQDAISRVETVSGTNARGHLLALSGPTAQQENDFIAARVGLENAWIGLTDDEAFGGGEAGTDGMAGFGNPPGDGIGWKWTTGEVFDYANWSSTHPQEDRDRVGLSRFLTWFTAGASSFSDVVEYETRSPSPLNLPPTPQPPLLPGPAPRLGSFGIREVARNGPIDPDGVRFALSSAIRSLQNITPQAIVRDYQAPLIDYQAEYRPSTGPNRPFEVLQRGDVSITQFDDFAMIAHGQILIPEGQGGDWTFNVTSDDGFELYIPGARFESVSGGLDPPSIVTPYGSLIFPSGRAAFSSLGHVSLQPGIHDIELIYYENYGFASVELTAAPGRKTRLDQSFALVGAPAQNVVGRNPAVIGQFGSTQVFSNPNGPGGHTPAEQITSIARAKQLLSAPDANDQIASGTTRTVDYENIAGENFGRYGEDISFIHRNNFAAKATANLSVLTAGTYTFGFLVLDGGELTISGAQFSESFGEGAITNGGQSLTLDRVTDDGMAFASVDLSAGTHAIEFVTYNHDGEALAELFVAPGKVDFFDTGAFTLLSSSTGSANYVRPAGLQLVPEPATMLSAMSGGMIASLVMWRRHFRRERTPKDLAGTARSK